MPEPPAAAVYRRAAGTAPVPPSKVPLAKGPSVNEMGEDVTDTVTHVKGMSLKSATRPNMQPPQVRFRGEAADPADKTGSIGLAV